MVPLETHSERWSSTRAPECVLNHHHYRLQLWKAALRADHSHSHSHFRAKPLASARTHCLLWGAKENQNAETQMQFHRRDAKKIPVFSSGTNGRHCVVCTVCKAGTYSPLQTTCKPIWPLQSTRQLCRVREKSDRVLWESRRPGECSRGSFCTSLFLSYKCKT